MRLTTPPPAVARGGDGCYRFVGARRRPPLGRNRVRETNRKLAALRRLDARRRR